MKRSLSALVLLLLLAACSRVSTEISAPSLTTQTATPTDDMEHYRQAWQQLGEEIETMGVQNTDVLGVMASVPRHKFVPSENLNQAYENHPLPTGYGQR